jgi:probable HAF family extracellular repeat protein
LEDRRLLSGYTITSLGTFGGPTSWAVGINNVGEVVGAADTKRYYWLFDARRDKAYYADAFLWKPTASNGTKGSLTDLGTLGGFQSEAGRINDFGQVIGSADFPTSTDDFLWTPSAPGGTSGVMTVLNGPVGPATYIAGIDATGHLVGSAISSSGMNNVFLWNPASPNSASVAPIDLSTSVGLTSAVAMNAAGQVFGTYQAADGTSHSCLWTPTSLNPPSGSILDLGSVEGPCLNNSGEVAARIGSDLVLYAGRKTYDLGSLYTGITSVDAISNTGQIVGTAHLSSGADHGFLWTPTTPNGTVGSLVDINTLTGSNSVTLEEATGINDQGQIVGFGTINRGSPQALLLTPNTKTALAQPAAATPPPGPATPVTGAPASPATGADVTASGSARVGEDGPTPGPDQGFAPVGSHLIFDIALTDLVGHPRPRKLVNDGIARLGPADTWDS